MNVEWTLVWGRQRERARCVGQSGGDDGRAVHEQDRRSAHSTAVRIDDPTSDGTCPGKCSG